MGRLTMLSTVLLAAVTAAGGFNYADVSEASFGMDPIPEYVFPARDFAVTDYGAKTDGSFCTAAFKQAIAACAAAGGGRVVVPAGTWNCGPIHLKSGVDLHLEKGAKLSFTDDSKAYLPPVMSSWEGLECVNYSPLVYAYGCTNVAITGAGTLEARMTGWARHFRETATDIQSARRILYTWGSEDHPVEKRDMTKASKAVMRPQLLQFNRSKNIRLEGIEIRDSPFWTCHLYQSENVVLRNVHVFAYGFNNDGVDIEMTKNVLIENSDFSAGDDGFVLKAGRNRDGWRVGRPTENVLIRNCHLRNATALVAVGSELSGGVRNVHLHDCTVDSTARLFYVKTNHRRGGFVENVRLSDVKVKTAVKLMAVETEVLYQWAIFPDYERRLTKISGLTLENVVCDGARCGIEINGDPEQPVDGVTFRNVRIGTLETFLSKVSGAANVRSDGLVFEKLGTVANPWDEVMPRLPPPMAKGAAKPKVESAWKGKKVAFLGDSITDPRHVGCTQNYWNYLANLLGLDAHVYGVNGCRMDGILDQAKRLMKDFHWYVDAIFVMAGTNDYNGSVPRGVWYDETREIVRRSKGPTDVTRRTMSMDSATFRGRINRLMDYLKKNFPDQQIVLMTPLHRGYATFGPKNVQPDELCSNELGLFIGDYADDIREAGRIWSVPVLDLYERSGLLPRYDSHARFFADFDRDRLHPNNTGHQRLAQTMAAWMQTIPPSFKRDDGLFE